VAAGHKKEELESKKAGKTNFKINGYYHYFR
jgi:hypothetical protein